MLSLYFDGSCFPTGTEAYGAYIVKEGDTVLHEADFIEAKEGTNNIAEWGGLVAGLRWLREHHPNCTVEIFGDSQLVCRQLTGQYACKKPHLQPYLNEARELLDGMTWTVTWVSRDKNEEADKLSKKRATPPVPTVAVAKPKVERQPCDACKERGYFVNAGQEIPCPDCFGKGYLHIRTPSEN